MLHGGRGQAAKARLGVHSTKADSEGPTTGTGASFSVRTYVARNPVSYWAHPTLYVRQDLATVSAQQVERVHAIVDVGEGVPDGEPLDWRVLEQACAKMAEASVDRLDSLEALLQGVDALLETTGRALLTAVAQDAPRV